MTNNQKNTFNKNKLLVVLKRFDIKLKELKYFLLAFSHSTYANEYKVESNERIEFLGDAILNFTTAEYIYHTFPKLPEGKMTKLRATYVCEDANFSYSKELGLDELLLLGRGEEQSGGREKKAVIADLFECFLGAVYLNSGLDDVKKILAEIVFPHIKNIDNEQFIDYKTKLQEIIQADHGNPLDYVVINQEGRPNEKIFTIAVKHDGITLGEGVGRSKKEAGQLAAKNALEKLVRK